MRELGAGGGSADDQDTALFELVRIAVIHRRELFDFPRQGLRNRWHAGHVTGAGCQHNTAAPPAAAVGFDQVTIAMHAH